MAVRFELDGLNNLRRHSRAQSGPYRRMWKQIGAIMLGFWRRRYNLFSKGGGDWKDLAPSTKRGRQKAKRGAKGPRRFAILVDTGLLQNALAIGSPGSLLERHGRGIRVGFSNRKHPDTDFTFADLADTHQHGNPAGNLPARPILVEPDERTKRTLRRVISATIPKAAGKPRRR
jgi:hypothetical protein